MNSEISLLGAEFRGDFCLTPDLVPVAYGWYGRDMNSDPELARSTGINLIDYASAAALLGIRTQSLRRLVSEKKVPHLHVGRLVRFDVRDLRAYIESKKVRVVQAQDGRE